MITLHIPRARAPSVPGLMGTHWALASFTASVLLGSMTTTSAPRALASTILFISMGGRSVAGFVPQTMISSELSMSLNISVIILPSVTCGAIMP